MINIVHNRGVGRAESAVNYLLGHDRKREHARVLRGDVDMTIDVINAVPFKKKYTSGVLSFEENNISEDAKQQIMNTFESVIFAGLDADQRQILWVEHRDKNRLELNYLVANQELHTGKSFTPYLHARDKETINAWREIVNDKFSLSNPDEPERKQAFVTAKDLPKTKKEAQQAINKSVENLIEAGVIQNREELIELLEKNGFEIARKTKKSISIKDPDGGQNIRLTGAVYEQDFRFSEDVRAQLERTAQQYRENSNTRIRDARKTLRARVERKREEHCKRYQKTSTSSAQSSAEQQRTSNTTQQNKMVRDSSNHNTINRDSASTDSASVLQQSADSASTKTRTKNNRDLLASREAQKRTNRMSTSAATAEINKHDRIRRTIDSITRFVAKRISSTVERFREKHKQHSNSYKQQQRTDRSQRNQTSSSVERNNTM